jgi:hypothetical protein
MRFPLESDHCQAAGLHAEYMMEKLGCSAKNIYAMSQVLGRLGLFRRGYHRHSHI